MVYDVKDNCMHFYSNERLRRFKPVPDLPQLLSYASSDRYAVVCLRGGQLDIYDTTNLQRIHSIRNLPGEVSASTIWEDKLLFCATYNDHGKIDILCFALNDRLWEHHDFTEFSFPEVSRQTSRPERRSNANDNLTETDDEYPPQG